MICSILALVTCLKLGATARVDHEPRDHEEKKVWEPLPHRESKKRNGYGEMSRALIQRHGILGNSLRNMAIPQCPWSTMVQSEGRWMAVAQPVNNGWELYYTIVSTKSTEDDLRSMQTGRKTSTETQAPLNAAIDAVVGHTMPSSHKVPPGPHWTVG